MKNILRNVVAVLVGAVVGGIANMALVILGPHLIAPPAGVDVTDLESLRTSIHMFEPKHFVFPFFAHALGTLVGSLVAFLIAASHHRALSYAVGAIFLAGGIANTFMIPAPAWFTVLDLVTAYIPMAWLGIWLGRRIRGRTA